MTEIANFAKKSYGHSSLKTYLSKGFHSREHASLKVRHGKELRLANYGRSPLRKVVDTLEKVDSLRVSSSIELKQAEEVPGLVNRSVKKHNNSLLKTILKFLIVPWVFATIIGSDFFKTLPKLQNAPSFEADINGKDDEVFFEEAMRLMTEGKTLSGVKIRELSSSQIDLFLDALEAGDAIKYLSLSRVSMSEEQKQRFFQILKQKSGLEEVSIKHIELGDGLAESLAHCTKLKKCNLSETGLTDGAPIAAMLSHDRLECLTLDSNNLKSNIEDLSDAVSNSESLEYLHLSDTGLTDTNCKSILRASKKLLYLDISWNTLRDTGEAVSELLSEGKIKALSLHKGDLTLADIKRIARALLSSETLQFLDVARNGISHDSVECIYLENSLGLSPISRTIRYSSTEDMLGKCIKALCCFFLNKKNFKTNTGVMRVRVWKERPYPCSSRWETKRAINA